MPHSGIYVIKNTLTNDVYVGSSSRIAARWKRHFHELKNGIHHSTYLQRAYDKYGKDAFTAYVVEDVEPQRQLLIEREQYWIEQLHPIYNMNPLATSNRGKKVSEATKANLLRYSLMRTTEERRQEHLGKTHTEESRRLMAEKATGRKHSEATLEKMRQAKRGTKQSEQVIEKRMQNMRGRIVSEETKARQSQGQNRRWANMTEEERQLASFKARNRPPISEETRRRMSESAKARRKS